MGKGTDGTACYFSILVHQSTSFTARTGFQGSDYEVLLELKDSPTIIAGINHHHSLEIITRIYYNINGADMDRSTLMSDAQFTSNF